VVHAVGGDERDARPTDVTDDGGRGRRTVRGVGVARLGVLEEGVEPRPAEDADLGDRHDGSFDVLDVVEPAPFEDPDDPFDDEASFDPDDDDESFDDDDDDDDDDEPPSDSFAEELLLPDRLSVA